MKKITVLVLLVCLLSLAACGGGGNNETYSNPQVLREAGLYPIVKPEYADEISLKVMGANNSSINVDWANNKFFKRMEELTGVKLTFEVYTDDMYVEKKGLSFNTSATLPDIFFKAFFNNYDEITYGSNGQLLALNGLIDEYAPNIKKLLDENPIIKKCITTTDGNIYALPTIYTNTASDTIMRGFWWINSGWLDELNLSMPTTTDELLEVLREFKSKKCTGANSYPLVVCGFDELQELFTAFGMDLSGYWVQADGNGELEFNPVSDNFRTALEFFRTLYKEELINRNWVNFGVSDKYAFGQTGDIYGMYLSASPTYVSGVSRLRQFTTLNPLTSECNDTPFWSATYPLERGCFAITSACRYPELAIRWIDTLYDTDEEYGLWAIVGKEGSEWKWNDEDKTTWSSLVPDETYSSVMSTTIIQTGDGMPYAVDESFFDKQATETDLYIRPLRNRQMEYGKVSYPMVYFNKKDLRTVSDLATDINTYVTRFISNAITQDNYLEKNWENFVKFDRMGLDEYMEILQKAYDDFYAE